MAATEVSPWFGKEEIQRRASYRDAQLVFSPKPSMVWAFLFALASKTGESEI
jgi:hypothetical protein